MATQQIAQGLAGLGRNGDSTLVHMQPNEVAGLQAIAKSHGTTLTTNPDTGLPEAFNLGGFFRTMAPTLAGAGMMMIPGGQVAGLTTLQAGIAAGALTGAALNEEDPLMGAVTGGFGGYGGANLAGSALGSGTQGAFEHSMGLNKAYSAGAGAGTTAPTSTIAGASNTITNGNIAPNMGQVNPVNNAANFQSDMGLNRAFQAGDPTYANLSEANNPSVLGNLNQAYQNVAEDPTRFLKQNAMGIGLPVGMAALAGMTPENNLAPKTDEYDPYATLNLGGSSSEGESGLRLLAAGGPVSFADGGVTPTIQSGGLQDLYGTRDDQTAGMQLSQDGYGMGRLQAMANGGVAGYAKGGYLDGPGDGMSDSIPATIEGKQPARLADGEFVVPADVVSHLGNGSTKAGSKRLYNMLDKVRKARTGNEKQGKQINPNKYMPA